MCCRRAAGMHTVKFNRQAIVLFSDCGNNVLANGLVSLAGSTTFGESATLSCNTGYTFAGDASTTCTQTGWNGTASCTIVGRYTVR